MSDRVEKRQRVAREGREMIERVRAFSLQVRACTDRLAEHRQRYQDTHGAPSSLVADDLLQELDRHHEELQVAEEELRVQVEQLQRLESTLTAERDALDEFLQFTPVAYLSTDVDGKVLVAQGATIAMFGIGPKRLAGQSMLALVQGEHAARLRSTLGILRSAPRYEGHAEMSTCRDGVRASFRARGSADGQRILWAVQDVTRVPSPRSLTPLAMPAVALPSSSSVKPAASGTLPSRQRKRLPARRRRLRLAASVFGPKALAGASMSSRPVSAAKQAPAPPTLLRSPTPSRGDERRPRHPARKATASERQAQGTWVDDMLDATDASGGELHLRLEPVDLRSLLESLLRNAEVRGQRQGVRVELDVGDTRPTVTGDRLRLVQVLDNLVDNALHATPTGGRIVLGAREENGGVRLWVKDTGIGIETSELGQVFDYGHQVPPSSGQDRGLGMGLFTVQRYVALHGGWVRGSSPGLGEGANFEIWLPSCGPVATPRGPNHYPHDVPSE